MSLRTIARLIDLPHDAGVAGIVRPTCPGCHRVLPIDESFDGMRVCRICIAHSHIEKCSRGESLTPEMPMGNRCVRTALTTSISASARCKRHGR